MLKNVPYHLALTEIQGLAEHLLLWVKLEMKSRNREGGVSGVPRCNAAVS